MFWQAWSITLHTLGLSELVNLTANESSEKLLSEGVVDNFAFWPSIPSSYGYGIQWTILTFSALFVLIELEALERSSTGYELMRELGFVVWILVASALIVHLIMSVFRVT